MIFYNVIGQIPQLILSYEINHDENLRNAIIKIKNFFINKSIDYEDAVWEGEIYVYINLITTNKNKGNYLAEPKRHLLDFHLLQELFDVVEMNITPFMINLRYMREKINHVLYYVKPDASQYAISFGEYGYSCYCHLNIPYEVKYSLQAIDEKQPVAEIMFHFQKSSNCVRNSDAVNYTIKFQDEDTKKVICHMVKNRMQVNFVDDDKEISTKSFPEFVNTMYVILGCELIYYAEIEKFEYLCGLKFIAEENIEYLLDEFEFYYKLVTGVFHINSKLVEESKDYALFDEKRESWADKMRSTIHKDIANVR